MNILYMLIVILIVLFFLFVTKTKLFKSFSMFFLIIVIIILAFIIDNSRSGHIVKAVEKIKNLVYSPVVKTNSFLVDNFNMSIIKIEDKVLIDTPVINQMPELPRGCEVTSLAMLLEHAGQSVNKMTLAKQIDRDKTPYSVKNGKIYFGHPNDGFVGNMYTYEKPGLGVYHKPIKRLAEKYLPGQIKDLTGSDLLDLKIHLSDGRPVWVIINTTYDHLPDSFFETWNTPSGKIKITYKEHSVLITGYDKDYIYFNDPLTGEKNRKAPIKDFEESWVQMGRQAITYL